MKTRVHVLISGDVQGVFFRFNTRNKANLLGVKGWVKNRWNGNVEAVFEGDEDLVNKMVEFCKKGPPGANVINVEVKKESYRGEFKDFEIRY